MSPRGTYIPLFGGPGHPAPFASSPLVDLRAEVRGNGRGSYGARVGAQDAGGAKSGADGVWTFVKYSAWTALGLGAVAVLSSVVTNVKKGRDPIGRWVGYGRGAR